MRIAIQIKSRGSASASLSRKGERAVAASLAEQDGIDVMWLPHRDKLYRDRAGNSVDSTILIFVAGVAFASLVKPFVESIAEEAGKDFWNVLKKALGKTVAQQAAETYRVSGKAYVLTELGEDWVAFYLPLPVVTRFDEIPADEYVQSELDEYFTSLSSRWDEIQNTVKSFRLGETRGYVSGSNLMFRTPADENVVHVIDNSALPMSAVSTKEFFGGVEID